MPVILENGSDQIRTWLDPNRSEWSKELQSLLKPYDGELDCYPVSKEVGKVGNNSPTFIVPIASTENKNNIANFFSSSEKMAKGDQEREMIAADEVEVEKRGPGTEQSKGEKRARVEYSGFEKNAPLPVPASMAALGSSEKIGSKRVHESDDDVIQPAKLARTEAQAESTASPEKPHGKKKRSATSNETKGGPPTLRDGSQRITRFFNK